MSIFIYHYQGVRHAQRPKDNQEYAPTRTGVVGSSDPAAPINALMQKRAFQISDYTFTGLPQKSDELFEPAPADDKTVEPKKS